MPTDIIARGMAASLPGQTILAQDAMIIRSSMRAKMGLGRVQTGTGRMTIACQGDSTTAGSALTRATSIPAMLAKALVGLGIPATHKNIFGANNSTTPTKTFYNTYNPEVTFGGGWTFAASIRSLGGNTFQTTATGDLTWAIPSDATAGPIDTINAYHLGGNVGSFQYQIDGVDVGAPIVTTTSQTFIKTVLTTTRGEHSFTVRWISGTANFIGAYAYDSTIPGVDVLNWGNGGAQSNGFADLTVPWSPARGCLAVAPDLTIYPIGINDDINGITPAALTSNIQIYLTTVLPGTDVWLTRPTPTSTSIIDFTDVYKSLSSINNCSYVDHKNVLGGPTGSWTVANTLGLMNDPNHPNAAGSALVGAFDARRLLSL